jgi:hypothetical protein
MDITDVLALINKIKDSHSIIQHNIINTPTITVAYYKINMQLTQKTTEKKFPYLMTRLVRESQQKCLKLYRIRGDQAIKEIVVGIHRMRTLNSHLKDMDNLIKRLSSNSNWQRQSRFL